MDTNISDFADTVGRSNIAKLMGVGATAVSNRVVIGHFPAWWFNDLEAFCIENGVDCPRSLFNWKPSSNAAPNKGVK